MFTKVLILLGRLDWSTAETQQTTFFYAGSTLHSDPAYELLGRLVVDVRFQGKGLGSILLADACRKIANASASLAMAGIVVQAKDEAAAGFYRHFGFKPLPGQPDRLLLPATSYRS